jgi:hypothetical protein
LLLLTTISLLPAQAQTYEELLQTGKDEIKKQRSITGNMKADYSIALESLEKAAKMRPNDPEVHYFLGSAYDYNTNPDGSHINETTVKSVMMASAEFEKVSKLAPKYTGDIIALDPYAKLTSIWGSRAMRYIVAKKKDSAHWAFKEGKRHGAFSDFGLTYYKYLLSTCKKDAIYFCYGDFSTFNCWYLQEMEHVRPDVYVVNLSMLQIPWYDLHLYKTEPGLFSSEAVAADTTLYKEWEKKVYIVPIAKTGEEFEWTVAPTNYEHYVLKCDLMVMDIVRHNKFVRPMYLEKNLNDEIALGLNNYVKDRLIVDEIVTNDSSKHDEEFYALFKTFPYDIFAKCNVKSDIEYGYVSGMRYEFLIGIDGSARKDKKFRAKRLMEQMKTVLPERTFPIADTTIKGYMDRYDDYLKQP